MYVCMYVNNLKTLLDPQKLEPRVVARRPAQSGAFQGGGGCFEA